MIKSVLVTGKGYVNSVCKELSKKQKPFILISIQDPCDKRPFLSKTPYCKGVLYLEFHDVFLKDDIVSSIRLDFDGNKKYKLFTEQDADYILDFVSRHKEDDEDMTVLCQCFAGISRSSAVAASVAEIYGIGKGAIDFFNSPLYCPNVMVYNMIWDYYMAVEERKPTCFNCGMNFFH